MPTKQEIQERLDKRLKTITEAKTLRELALSIWTSELDNAIGTREEYRRCFREWIQAKAENREPNLWNKYKTIDEMIEAIWDPRFDISDSDVLWFDSLRNALREWIKNYVESNA